MKSVSDQKVIQTIIQKAWSDADFKTSLLNNPLETLEKFLGHPMNLPKGQKIIFSDQSDPKTIYINIPVNEDTLDIELSEDELDIAAGGTDTNILGNIFNRKDG